MSSLDVSFSSPTTVDKEPLISTIQTLLECLHIINDSI